MKSKIAILAAVLVVLIAGFVILKPKAAQGPESDKAATKSPKTFTLVVKDRKLVSGPATPGVTQGDDVIIKITNDEDEELHLHGYDKAVDLEKDKQAELHFTADKSGDFPYELEHSGTELGSLQVQPK